MTQVNVQLVTLVIKLADFLSLTMTVLYAGLCLYLVLFKCAFGQLGAGSDERVIIPLVGFGTAGLQGKTHETVLSALNLGVRMIDSAQAKEWYNEVGVGTAVAEFETTHSEHGDSGVVIVTKIHPRSYGDITAMDAKLAESKTNFHRDGLDVVLLHAPWCWPGHCTPAEEAAGWETGWNNLVSLRDKHNIRAIGVSNFHFELLHKLVVDLGQQVDVVQNWMDPFHQDAEVRAFCAEHNIQYMAYSSFGTQWNRQLNPVLADPVFQDIADRHEVTVPQVVMMWLHTLQVVAIPRTSQIAHMKDNFAELIRDQEARQAAHHHHQQCVMRADGTGSDLTDTNTEAGASVDLVQGLAVCGAQTDLHEAQHLPMSWHLSPEELNRITALDGTLGTPWD